MVMLKHKRSMSVNKKTVAFILFVIALLVAGGLFLVNKKDQKSDTPVTGINFGPPTEQEKAEAEQHKEEVRKRLEQEQNANNQPQSGTKSVTPLISSWGQNPDTNNLEVAGFIPEIYEDGGKCTLTLTRNGQTITKDSSAHKDVSRTSCQPFAISQDSLTPGTWSATLKYASSTATGSSTSTTITVK